MLDFLTQLNSDSFMLFVIGWGLFALVSSSSLFFSGQMPISGRIHDSRLEKLGVIDKKMGWIIMEVPILISVIYFYAAADTPMNVSVVMVGFFVMHYANRALIYPHRIKTHGKTMPISMVASSMLFYIINGYLIGHYFGALRSYPIEWLYDPRFILGSTVFLAGFYLNISSDNILIKLRKPGESGYKIPHGGLFKYISSPHYLGEILEWVGFAILTWSLPGVVYAVWVVLPLFAQSLSAHKWYLEKFKDDYPANRKAIIPGII